MPQQNTGSGSWVKWVLGFVVLLLAGACIVGMLFADSYWGNPPQELALAERTQIENRGLEAQQDAQAEGLRIDNRIREESWEIESEARRRESEDNSIARQERAEHNLVWLDRWNQFGMFTVAVAIVALLIGVGARIIIPLVVKARVQEAERRTKLVEQKMKLHEKEIELEKSQTERLQNELRLEQMHLQRDRTRENARGNGKGHTVPLEEQMVPPRPLAHSRN